MKTWFFVFVKLVFLVKFDLFCEIWPFLWNWPMSFPMEFFVKCNLTASRIVYFRQFVNFLYCVLFLGAPTFSLYALGELWISCNSSYERRRDFILGLKDAQWPHFWSVIDKHWRGPIVLSLEDNWQKPFLSFCDSPMFINNAYITLILPYRLFIILLLALFISDRNYFQLGLHNYFRYFDLGNFWRFRL